MESTRLHNLENTHWKRLWTSSQKNFTVNKCREINELHNTGQHYCLETHIPTNMPATMTAYVIGFVKRAQANAATANSSISYFNFNSCARVNQLEVCIELL
jgi:hypothetical protein